MHIDIWSDVVCPFCYIGKAHLEAALKATGLDAEIRHMAFRLQPGELPQPVSDMLARKYGLTGAAAAVQQRSVEAMAAEAGLEFHLDGTWIGDTRDAHRLIKLAGQQGLAPRMLDRLYRAYFSEGRDVLGRDSLAVLAAEAGVTGAAAMLDSDAFVAEVDADQRFAPSLNVRGVPFVVIDRKLAISGAHPVDVFVQALRQAAPVADGAACGLDGCD